MNLGLFAVLLLAGSPRMAFWGGSVAIPEGCRGPATVRMNVDWFAGEIVCPDAGLSMWVAGGMVESACDTGKASKARTAQLTTVEGHEVLFCRVPARGDRAQEQLGAVIGLAGLTAVHVTAAVRSPLDAQLFLEVVSSYRPSKAK